MIKRNTPIPEILAPVGDLEMCQAAVHNGAGAIYVGAPGFNARGRTIDFTIVELEEIIKYCHLYGVKVFVALNILIFQNELNQLSELLPKIIALSPDAIIVQDLGLAALIRKISPTMPIHASTQMTITSHESIHLVDDLGFERYVLGREVSIPEMTIIRENTDKELEVFVHGALCVAYSGQCLTSENVGGRSANRGQCAQSCRLDYELIVDGKKKELGNQKYLVSPKDLCGVAEIPRLMEIGTDSFKIEGRLKAPEYVATTVSNYRKAVDQTLDGKKIQVDQDAMEIAFSRDFYSGWLHGVNHQELVDGRFSAHRGLKIGQLIQTVRKRPYPEVEVESFRELDKGDSLLFVDQKKQIQTGGKIYQVNRLKNKRYRVSFARDFRIQDLKSGSELFLNRSPKLDRQLQQSWKDRNDQRRVPLNMKLTGKENAPLKLIVQDDMGNIVTESSEALLQKATKAPLSESMLKKELGALGTTCFQLVHLDCQLEGELFLFQKAIKRLRQQVVESLEKLRLSPKSRDLTEQTEVLNWINQQPIDKTKTTDRPPSLNVLIRNADQLEGLRNLNIDTVYLDFEYGRLYKPVVEKVRAMGYKAGIATTRILKPKEYKHLRVINSIQPDRVLVRNLGALHYFRQQHPENLPFELIGDFSLNVTNRLAADYLLSKGLNAICPAYDLNEKQLYDLLDKVAGSQFEITIHQYMPAFHMEHCVFAAFLSDGSSYRDCGMPCKKYRVELKDNQGVQHPLNADQECRNTMFNGVPQSAGKLIPNLLKRGVCSFRVEALNETPEQLHQKVLAYQHVLHSDEQSSSLLEQLGIMEKYGVSEGQLKKNRAYKDRKKTRKSKKRLLSHDE